MPLERGLVYSGAVLCAGNGCVRNLTNLDSPGDAHAEKEFCRIPFPAVYTKCIKSQAKAEEATSFREISSQNSSMPRFPAGLRRSWGTRVLLNRDMQSLSNLTISRDSFHFSYFKSYTWKMRHEEVLLLRERRRPNGISLGKSIAFSPNEEKLLLSTTWKGDRDWI